MTASRSMKHVRTHQPSCREACEQTQSPDSPCHVICASMPAPEGFRALSSYFIKKGGFPHRLPGFLADYGDVESWPVAFAWKKTLPRQAVCRSLSGSTSPERKKKGKKSADSSSQGPAPTSFDPSSQAEVPEVRRSVTSAGFCIGAERHAWSPLRATGRMPNFLVSMPCGWLRKRGL